jgi:hypothetical protein
MTNIIDCGTTRTFNTLQLAQVQRPGMEAVLSEAQASEVDAWHKRAERNLEDGRGAMRARRDVMNRVSQQRHIELEAEAAQEPSEEDTVLLAEAARLERSAKEKLARTASSIQSARSIVDSASTDAAAASGQPRFENHDEFYDMIIALLGDLDAEWLSKYEDLLANYIAFFDELTKALAKLSDAIKGVDDDGNFDVDFGEAWRALDAVAKKWAGLPLVAGFETEEKALAFLSDLGVQGLVVKPSPGGGWEIRVNTDAVTEIRDLLESDDDMNPAEYNAIIAAKDSRLERLSQVNNLLAEKYNRQNQQWDTLVKVLSNSIKEMDEAQRSFVNGL